MRSILVLAYALALVGVMVPLCGCACDAPQYAEINRVQTYATPCAASAANPCGAPMVTRQDVELQMEAPIGVDFVVGPREHFNSFISVPPDVALCLVDAGHNVVRDVVEGVRCALNKLYPTPTPSQRLRFRSSGTPYVVHPNACPTGGCAPTPQRVAAPTAGCK